MMKKILIVAVGVAGLLASAIPAVAHHAFGAEFDANKPVKFTGTVTRMEWVNPHSWIHVDIKKPDGTVEEWMFEGGTPNTLLRRGFDKNSLKPGTEVTITGFQSKDGQKRANGLNITLPDGRELFLGSTGTGAPYDDKGDAAK